MCEPINSWQTVPIQEQLGQAWGRAVSREEVDVAMGVVTDYSVPFAERVQQCVSGWEILSSKQQRMVATGVGSVAVGCPGDVDRVVHQNPSQVAYLGKSMDKTPVDEPLTGEFYD